MIKFKNQYINNIIHVFSKLDKNKLNQTEMNEIVKLNNLDRKFNKPDIPVLCLFFATINNSFSDKKCINNVSSKILQIDRYNIEFNALLLNTCNKELFKVNDILVKIENEKLRKSIKQIENSFHLKTDINEMLKQKYIK